MTVRCTIGGGGGGGGGGPGTNPGGALNEAAKRVQVADSAAPAVVVLQPPQEALDSLPQVQLEALEELLSPINHQQYLVLTVHSSQYFDEDK